MGLRVTQRSIMNNYSSGLQSVMSELNDWRNQVMTGRKLTNASQDPATATIANHLERKLARTRCYIDTVDELMYRQNEQESGIMNVINACTDIGENISTAAMQTGTHGLDERKIFAQQIKGRMDEILFSMNAQYSSEYVFGGNEGMAAPFTVDETTGKLMYRGVAVSSEEGTTDFKKLQEMEKEKVFVDVGYGLELEEKVDLGTKDAISASAFDISQPGIASLGYGVDKDGDPKNIYEMARQMKELLEDENGFDTEKYNRLWGKFQAKSKEIDNYASRLGTQTNLLQSTKKRLEDSELNLTKELDNLVNIDPAESITEYSYAMYTYNAALKVGTSILSQSLLDYLNI